MLVVGTLSAIADHFRVYLASVLLAGGVSAGLNYVFLKRWVSGLMFLQVSFIFNTAIILFGWATGAVSLGRVGHFLAYELAVVIGMYWVYRRILRQRARVLEGLRRLRGRAVWALLVAFNLGLLGVYLVFVVQNDGSSRIEFMTANWFSFLRPVMSILTPLTFFVPLYLLDCGQRFLPLSLLASAVLSSIASGSKGALAFGLVAALLFYQDLKGSRLNLPKALKFALLTGLSVATVFALARLEVTLPDLADRFVRFGEATIMVYYSGDPAAAAAGVSTLAKIHRGGAKLLGDRSAADVDTLFGFALSQVEYGAHNFTGPNAQIPSYMLCNYSGWENLIGLASILGYLAMMACFFESLLQRPGSARMMLLPFVVASLNAFPQDYYQGMSDATVIGIAALVFAGASVAALAGRRANRIDAAA
jgi:hypothetical protein